MPPSLPPVATGTIIFGPFRLDLDKRVLRRGDSPIELRRKAWDVLRYLCERPDRVVSNDELLDAVWPDVTVTPQTVTNVIRELRVALADHANGSRWIRTLRGRGHVFRAATADEAAPPSGSIVVGRDSERARLDAAWDRARRGEPQVVLVTGEPGIGKTTLLDDLTARLAGTARGPCWIGRGAGVEQHAEPESHLPLLAAVAALATGGHARDVAATLRRTAPTWLMRLPHLLRPSERLRLEPALVGATATRMLREGLDALRALADHVPLVLVVEDLHWADPATLDVIAALARLPGPLRLLAVATFRSVDPALRDHPITVLARELVHERRADVIALAPLDAAAIADYLRARLGARGPADLLGARLEALSAGNPLFLRALVDALVESGAVAAHRDGWSLADDPDRLLAELPESLRAFVTTEAARLPRPLRQLVEAASVVGSDAAVPELALMLERPAAEIAEGCERLAASGRLLRHAGETPWPDGGLVGRYAFPHAAHRRIVYDGVATHERRALHARLAHGLEAAHGARAREIAARLAGHFDQAGLVARAVDYYDLAASAAESRFAYGEAAAHLATAIARLDATAAPDGDQSIRSGQLHVRHGELSVLAHGYSRPEVEHAYARAREIFERAGDPHGLFAAEMGLAVIDLTLGRYHTAHARMARVTAIATGRQPELAVVAGCWAGFASSALGELTRARTELEAGIATDADPSVPRHFSVARMLRSQLALVCTVTGDAADARRHEDDARTRSRAHGAASERAHAELLAAERAVFLRAPDGHVTTTAAIALAEANGLVSFLALLRIYDAALRPGWPTEHRLAVMRAALADRARLGDRWHTALLLGLIAEVELASDDPARAVATLDEAFAHVTATDERYYEAELYRLRAEHALACERDRRTSEPEQWLERAITVARAQGATLWEERARARRASLR